MTVALYTSGSVKQVRSDIAKMRIYCVSRGWTIKAKYVDTLDNKDLPMLRKFDLDVWSRKFDHALIMSVGKLGSSGTALEYLGSSAGYDYAGIPWSSYTEPHITEMPAGDWRDVQIVFSVCLAMATAANEQLHAIGKSPARQ